MLAAPLAPMRVQIARPFSSSMFEPMAMSRVSIEALGHGGMYNYLLSNLVVAALFARFAILNLVPGIFVKLLQGTIVQPSYEVRLGDDNSQPPATR
jgi:hypothetical protein